MPATKSAMWPESLSGDWPLCSSKSLGSDVPCVRSACEFSQTSSRPVLRNHSLDAGLNCSKSVHRALQQLSQSICPFDHLWRPSVQLVQSSGWQFRSFNAQKPCATGSNSFAILFIIFITLRKLITILYPCLQVASEKVELLAALIEYEKDINLLESLYNNNKELLDQQNLDTDLEELAEYAWSCFPFLCWV